jgi:hypothetical protein
MPQVKYIAAGIKIDSIRGVGLHWEPGQVRNVTAEVAERLTVYSDTWIAVEDESLNAEPVGLSTEPKPAEEPLPVINFHAMDKKALLEFAETKYGEKFDKRKSEIDLRHRVIDLAAKHELDNEDAQ